METLGYDKLVHNEYSAITNKVFSPKWLSATQMNPALKIPWSNKQIWPAKSYLFFWVWHYISVVTSP